MLYPRRPQNCFKQVLGLLLSLVFLTSGFVLPGDFRNQRPNKARNSKPADWKAPEKSVAGTAPVKTAKPSEPDQATHKRVSEAYGKLPLSFEANNGQTDPRVKFLSRGRGYNLFLTSTEAVLALSKPAKPKNDRKYSLATSRMEETQTTEPSVALRMKLVGANSEAQMAGLEELPGKTNYFTGSDQSEWHTNIPTYAKVKYEEVYSGVDMVYHGSRRQLEYDFVVEPGADPDDIKLEFEGAQRTWLSKSGDLVLETAAGTVRWQKPVIYQEVGGDRRTVAGRYVLLPADRSSRSGERARQKIQRVGFQIARYDSAYPLVIDPTLLYSTLVGGVNWDMAFGLAVGQSGHAYITGWTHSFENFPTTAGAYQTTGGNNETVFVTKLNPVGTGLIYSTFLNSGVGQSGGTGIAVDGSGNAYITGFTSSGGRGFPTTPGAFQATSPDSNYSNAFITKLNPTGSGLVYSTFLTGGPDSRDEANDIAIDSSGNAYVTGFTWASSFPRVNAAQPSRAQDGNPDAFVTKLNATGSALLYSTHLGGDRPDVGWAIAVDGSNRAYVTGFTNSINFPTTAGAFQPTPGGTGLDPFGTLQNNGDAFVTRMSVDGSTFDYSTFLGGVEGDEGGRDIAVDAAGSAFVTGYTSHSGFPTTPGAFQESTTFLGPDAFITKLNPSGSSLAYSTRLGGEQNDFGESIALDDAGNAYITGPTNSPRFPTLNALQPSLAGGGLDAFVTKLNPTGSQLIYSTYLGGSGSDNIGNSSFRFGLSHIAVDDAGRAYVAGWTDSLDFPTSPDAFQRLNRGGYDAFIAKLGASSLPPGLALEAISPKRGGNTGPVTTKLIGSGFAPGMTVKLTRAGQPDVVASPLILKAGDLATGLLDLRGKSAGIWDVVATGSDGTSARLAGAFTIEAGGGPIIWTDLVGPTRVLTNRPTTYTVVVGNRGNTDALGVILFIGGIPRDATVEPLFEITRPANTPLIDFSQISPFVKDHFAANAQTLPLLLPVVRAGQSIPIRFRVSVPTDRLNTFRVSAVGPLLEFEPTVAGANKGLRESLAPPGGEFLCDPHNASCFNCFSSLPLGAASCLINLANLIRQLACLEIGAEKTPGGVILSVSLAIAGLVVSCATGGLADDAAKAVVRPLIGGVGDALGAAAGCSECFTGKGLGALFASAFDPNDKVGSVGIGEPHFLTGEEPLRYTIFFENKPAATAPAHEVVITDQLSANLDLATFEPGPVSFGNRQALLTRDGNRFTTTVDLRPGKNLLLRISASLNTTTGVLTWRFTSIDPATGEMPEDAFAGFLPPNRTPPEGEGSVFFTIMPKRALPSGTEIRNKASIVFDFNQPIETPEWLNTIDNSKPESRVLPLATVQNFTGFEVKWGGTDLGPGVQSYGVFVSEDGGPFAAWLNNTTATSSFFFGKRGSSYSFYTVAKDAAGNREEVPAAADATTQISPTAVNIIEEAGFFVRLHYLDFLNREPDASGLAFWSDQITSCGTDTACVELRRINVSAAFFLSIEFQQTGYLVYRLYKAAYGNIANTPVPVRLNEFLPDTQQIGKGVVVGQTGWEQVLENNKNLFAADFVDRGRFKAAHPNTLTPEQFVDALFTNASVSPPATERTAIINEFGGATNTADTAVRARVLRRVAENSLLAQQEFNKAFVLMQYLGYLRRNPNDAPDTDFAGYNFWLGKLNQFNGNFVNADMVKAFIVSGEYRQRFGR